ncbi:MAG: hypothetical protein MI919_38140 [Holophagales bacterium]|nr:hypothetical protein [Holophagales bacterium]
MYMLPDQLLGEHQSLLEVSAQVPDGVICLLSALAYHEIGTQLPREVWVAIGGKARIPKVSQVATRFVRFSTRSLEFGVEKHSVRGVALRITTPAKTVADCFKYRNKIGLDVVIEALRGGLHSGKVRIADLEEAAGICRVRGVMRPYLEALLE